VGPHNSATTNTVDNNPGLNNSATTNTVDDNTGPIGTTLRAIPSTVIFLAMLVVVIVNRRKWLARKYRHLSQERSSYRRRSRASDDRASVREDIPLRYLPSPPPAYSPYHPSLDERELVRYGSSLNQFHSSDQMEPSVHYSHDNVAPVDTLHLFSFEERGPAESPQRFSIVDRGPRSVPNSPYPTNLADRELMGTAYI
jgi:hypothetical protein